MTSLFPCYLHPRIALFSIVEITCYGKKCPFCRRSLVKKSRAVGLKDRWHSRGRWQKILPHILCIRIFNSLRINWCDQTKVRSKKGDLLEHNRFFIDRNQPKECLLQLLNFRGEPRKLCAAAISSTIWMTLLWGRVTVATCKLVRCDYSILSVKRHVLWEWPRQSFRSLVGWR